MSKIIGSGMAGIAADVAPAIAVAPGTGWASADRVCAAAPVLAARRAGAQNAARENGALGRARMIMVTGSDG
jgi:hypothetical protein